MDADRMRFLNVVFPVNGPQAWRNPAMSKLWRYQLHYFDDLHGATSTDRAEWHRSLLCRWIEENPAASGDGWEPYPTSLRIVNWIKWSLAGNDLPEECVPSLAQQAGWLFRNLEHHLLGNHLFENAKALIFAGWFFSGPAAEKWLSTAWQILGEEIPEQVLADGGHFERSPMYHAIILEGLLDIINVSRCFDGRVPMKLDPICSQMLTWLDAMSHPDGGIALLNDATLDGAPNCSELRAYAERLGIVQHEAVKKPLHTLPDSGYARVHVGPAVALLDIGPLGPDYLPAHGHADTLGFEMSLDNRRVVVDTGVSTYEIGPVRDHERGTSAHNTWAVDGRNSSDVWAAFRVGRRAKVLGVRSHERDSHVEVEAAHDGFLHLPCRTVHRRRWVFTPDELIIHDEFAGRGSAALSGSLHFHPDLVAVRDGETGWRIFDPGGRMLMLVVPDSRVDTVAESFNYAPNFGESRKATALRFALTARLPVELVTRVRYGAE